MPAEHDFPDPLAKNAEGEFQADRMSLSMGPSHPSTHGVLRIQMELDGEVVTKADPVVGYLHRGDEKIAENMTYNQFVPFTDRLDYLAPLANNMAYAIAVEKLARLEVPARCQAIRVITAEMARISSHLLGLGAFGIDVGAWTVFLYSFGEREKLYKLFEELTGARFTTSYTRIGGVARDVPDGWIERVDAFCDQFPPLLEETLDLLTRNKIFQDRTVGVGVISAKDAVRYGLTGPNLRGSGVPLDLRKDKPYSGYEKYEFDVPVGEKGDCYDRYLVRGEAAIAGGKGTLGKLINDDSLYTRASDAVDRLDRVATNLDQGKGSAGKLLKDDSLYNNLNAAVDNANHLVAEINAGHGALGKLAKDPAFAQRLDDTVSHLDSILKSVDEGNGTLGQLVHNRALYDHADQTMDQAQGLIKGMREDPKKYLVIRLKMF